MAWAMVGAAAVSVVGGAIAAHNAPSSTAASSAADPFASQRPQYQQQLQTLMANPSSVASTPGYQFQMQQGLDATQASNAAKGIGTSGANDAAKMQYAQGLASSTYQQDFNNLALLSGATSGSPAAASQALTAQNASTASGIGTIAGAAGKGFSSWMNSGTGSVSESGADPG